MSTQKAIRYNNVVCSHSVRLTDYCIISSSNSRLRFACLNTTQVSLAATKVSQSSHCPKISLGRKGLESVFHSLLAAPRHAFAVPPSDPLKPLWL